MRIAVVHNLSRGGAHRRLREQVARAPWPVIEICLTTASPIGEAAHVIDYEPLAPGARAIVRPPLRYADLARLLAAWRQAARAATAASVDAIYVNPCRFLQTPPLVAPPVCPTLYFCDEPRRVDVEPAAIASRRRGTRPLYAPLYGAERWIDGRGARRSTAVVTNSRYTASRIRDAYDIDADVVLLGVDAGFAPTGAPGGNHLLSVGTLIPSKGHDVVIETAGRIACRRPVVVVAPRHDAAEEARLRALAGTAGVELDIRIAIDDGELRRLYGTAHATLYLARSEPLGLVSLEAQACGCPVVVAAEGGLPETIEEGVTGFAVARSAAAAVRALARLDEPGVRSRMAADARERAMGLTWERSSEDVWRRLEMLVEQARARRRARR
jgi:glycosyltransferase involved in cell wall biosynthesis